MVNRQRSKTGGGVPYRESERVVDIFLLGVYAKSPTNARRNSMQKNKSRKNLKLSLNRETLRALNEAGQLEAVVGGLTAFTVCASNCKTCDTRCC
jgi:hypothetical protein